MTYYQVFSHLCPVFQGLLAVLIYGILFYPLFACLTTDNKLLGSVLGFLYGAVRLAKIIGNNLSNCNVRSRSTVM